MKAKTINWLRQVESGVWKSNTVKIIGSVKQNPDIDTLNLIKVTGLKHQTMTSVMNTIMDEGLITFSGQRTVNGTVYSTYRFVTDMIDRENLIRSRQMEKFVLWAKRGNNDFEHLMNHELKQLLKVHVKHYTQYTR